MPRLLDELRMEHKSIIEVLDCLERQVRRLEADQPVDFDVIRAALDYFGEFPDRCHHPKEDLIFARLIERDRLSAWIVGDLHRAHEQLAESLKTFAAAIKSVLLEAELPRAEIAGWAGSFIELQRRHLAMEQASFFPAAERSLSPEDWLALEAAVPKEADPLRGATIQAKYHALHDAITAWDAEDRMAEAAQPAQ